MIFIALLIIITSSVATVAAFFSVYGLAATFSGVFWSVVAMGASLEAAKLMSASFLYRYWDRINFWLKSYLMLGTAALMLLTSVGIFGYLSAGYQQDALPLKQKQEQVRLLEDEKSRLLARKEAIDSQLSGGPQLGNIQSSNGRIDPNAARVLRETNRGRTAVVNQYKAEQATVNARVTELDSQLLELKQDLIKVEAHTGPITFIAKAFGLDTTDSATTYLIMVIIFAFDPMAVALTLAVNIALRLRKEDKEAKEKEEDDLEDLLDTDYKFSEEEFAKNYTPISKIVEPEHTPEPIVEEVIAPPVPEPTVEPEPVELELEPIVEPEVIPEPEPVVEEVVTPAPAPSVVVPTPDAGQRRNRPYSDLWQSGEIAPNAKINELVQFRQHQRARIARGEVLSQDEMWELEAVDKILQRHNLGAYLN